MRFLKEKNLLQLSNHYENHFIWFYEFQFPSISTEEKKKKHFFKVYPGQCDEGQQNNIKLQEIKEPRIIMQIISSFNE